MISKPIVLGLLAAGCVTAAAGGAYFAVRHNSTDRVGASASAPATSGQAVAESEAVVTPADRSAAKPQDAPSPARVEEPARPAARKEATRPTTPPSQTAANTVRRPADPAPAPPMAVEKPRETAPVAPAPLPSVQPEPPAIDPPVVPARPQIVEVVVPASSVIGLQVETSISSETARVEDRVEARVTRDVMADGRVAVPAGSKAIGDVVLVERGGKMKDKARLGVRFHTLVLADGSQVAFRSDSIFRDGASPGNESARKIGGAAVGGAILGAILGGAKGAAIGGATGAGAGSAVVMAGDRNPATLPGGTVVNVRLTSPVTVDIEKEN
jgi:Bacterial conjugation TrbI-like protein